MSTTYASEFEFLRPRWERNTDASDSDGCWPWLLRPGTSGYGQLGYPKNQTIRAHRLSYLLHKGDIPPEMVVRHTCDNPICVRPDHLILGTRADNLEDCRRRGRWHNHKKPEKKKVGRFGPERTPPSERLWPKVKIGNEDQCWPFSGKRDQHGYGILGVGRNGRVRAHRVAYEDRNGPIPDGLVVMHICDNPPCCNPSHLQLGTRADNNRDRSAKGRGRENRQWGEHNPRSKLSPDDVLSIRTLAAAGGMSQREIGEGFGIAQAQVSKIISGISWPDGPWPTEIAVLPITGSQIRQNLIETVILARDDHADN